MPTPPLYTSQNYPQDGDSLSQRVYPEAASQVFRTGDPVYLNSSGQLVIAATFGSLLSSAGNKPIGIACADASNLAAASATPNIPVDIIGDGSIAVCPVTHATPASAVTAQSQIGAAGYQLRINPAGSPGGVSYAIDNTANPMIQVLAIHPEYAVGEQYGWAECKWIAGALQFVA